MFSIILYMNIKQYLEPILYLNSDQKSQCVLSLLKLALMVQKLNLIHTFGCLEMLRAQFYLGMLTFTQCSIAQPGIMYFNIYYLKSSFAISLYTLKIGHNISAFFICKLLLFQQIDNTQSVQNSFTNEEMTSEIGQEKEVALKVDQHLQVILYSFLLTKYIIILYTYTPFKN